MRVVMWVRVRVRVKVRVRARVVVMRVRVRVRMMLRVRLRLRLHYRLLYANPKIELTWCKPSQPPLPLSNPRNMRPGLLG